MPQGRIFSWNAALLYLEICCRNLFSEGAAHIGRMLIVLLEFRAARACQDTAIVEVLSCMELMRRNYSSSMDFQRLRSLEER